MEGEYIYLDPKSADIRLYSRKESLEARLMLGVVTAAMLDRTSGYHTVSRRESATES